MYGLNAYHCIIFISRNACENSIQDLLFHKYLDHLKNLQSSSILGRSLVAAMGSAADITVSRYPSLVMSEGVTTPGLAVDTLSISSSWYWSQSIGSSSSWKVGNYELHVSIKHLIPALANVIHAE